MEPETLQPKRARRRMKRRDHGNSRLEAPPRDCPFSGASLLPHLVLNFPFEAVTWRLVQGVTAGSPTASPGRADFALSPGCDPQSGAAPRHPAPPIPTGTVVQQSSVSKGCFHFRFASSRSSLARILSRRPAGWCLLTSEAVPNQQGWKTTPQVTY